MLHVLSAAYRSAWSVDSIHVPVKSEMSYTNIDTDTHLMSRKLYYALAF